MTSRGLGETAIERLASFCAATTLGDMPEEVVDRAKLLVLDSLTCVGGALATPRGQMAVRRWRAAEGSGHALVFGCAGATGPRAVAAALADLGNVLDADDTFLNSAHFAVLNVAAAVAQVQHVGAPGAQLVRAVALGFEVNARPHLALRPDRSRPDQQSTSYPALGAAASAAVVAGLPAGAIASALSVVCWLTPTSGTARLRTRSEFTSFKYAAYGAIASSAIDAVAYASEGYVGDFDALDDPTWARAHGCTTIDGASLPRDLGSKWWVLDTSFKPYPSFRLGHGHLDAVRALVEEGARPDDLDIELRLDPRASALTFVRSECAAIDAGQFAPTQGATNLPHSVACIAAGVPIGPEWYSERVVSDPKVEALARRVRIAPDPAVPLDEYLRRRYSDAEIQRSFLGATRACVEGEDRVIMGENCLGDPWSESTRWTWELGREKLDSFCAALGQPARRMYEAARRLELLGDARALLA